MDESALRLVLTKLGKKIAGQTIFMKIDLRYIAVNKKRAAQVEIEVSKEGRQNF